MSEGEKKSKWNKVGAVLSKKNGKGTYIKISADATFKEGDIINVFDPRTRPGIKPEQLEKIPDFVKMELFTVED